MLLGDSGVGKTCFLLQFRDGAFLSGTFIATVGIDFRNKVVAVDGVKVKLQIWDTAGQERFRSVTHAYYRDAQALLLLYDITSKMSFDNIRAWLTEIHEYAQKDVVIMLLGNKADVSSERAVRTEDGASLARVSPARICTPCYTPTAPQARVLHLGTRCGRATRSARCPDPHGTGGTAGRGCDPAPKPHPAKRGRFWGAGGGLGLPPDGAVPPLQEYGVPFMETSAKTGMNVELAFLAIAKELKQRALQPPDEPRFQIHDYIEAQQKKSGCCAFA
ncbi:Ras-related protein Rab-37 [Aix galericulata]|nr:Ras-related protein Rab-37 [Aix galericulata]